MSNRQINDVFKNKEAMNRVGLINVHERIQLNYGKMYGIEIISEKGKGTRIDIFYLREEILYEDFSS